MSIFLHSAFWVSAFIVFFTYLGYGVIIAALAAVRKKNTIHASNEELPAVSLVIAAYNEEDFIRRKIHDCMALDYPSSLLTIVFVTDGSTDRTPEIVQSYPNLVHYHEQGRKGKIHAVNRVMKNISTPITVFCDANTFLNPQAIRLLVRHYRDPRVGGVAGEKRIFQKESDNASGSGEGLYWKYESFLKKKDAEVCSVVGAAGELFSVRTELYEAPDENMIIEDFYMSLRIAARGYAFAYEPEAFATETASASVSEEWKRKVRIAAGGFQAMQRLTTLLNPFRHGILSFQYVGHRVLRWTLAPLSLPVLLLTSALLSPTHPFYAIALAAQVLFYGMALLGYLWRDKSISIKGFFVPYYFTVMNAAVFAGFFRFIRGRQSVVWERAQRAQLHTNES